MTLNRHRGHKLVVLLGLASIVLPKSALTDGLIYLAFAYTSIDLVLRARSGYLRRRPYWTADSWLRYLKAMSVPVGAFAIMALMMVAFEWRLPIVGAARSTVRAVWAGGTLFFAMIFALGFVTVLDWLHEGDPSRQFVLPRWLTFGRSRTA